MAAPTPKKKVSRRLAAILAADVVGYSRLVGQDEEGTIARLKALREELIDPSIAKHDGRIFKTMGDGLLVEFASVVDAVKCAVEWQRAMDARESAEPEDRRLRFRIGVNLGDIIIDGDDILGDGVNVAARLEGLAEAGGVSISGAVFEQIESKLDIAFDDAGEQKVKNIAKPIRVYRLRRDGAEGVEAEAMPALELPDIPSIAVLPFENMSGDPEQEYFSDGIAEDIITDLSKISGLFVIARNSSFAYKSKPKNLSQVCRELGVRYVLEGSVRKAGNRVRINAQLIDGTTGGHVWADRRDGDLTDIFALQDEVTNQIVTALRVTLTDDEGGRVGRKGTDNLEAYDWYQRARELGPGLTKEDTARARRMLETAIRLDPNFGAAHAALAMTHTQDYGNQWGDDPAKSLGTAKELARRAVALGADEPFGHFALGIVHLWFKQHDSALAEAEKAIALDPNAAEGRVLLANIFMFIGRREEAIENFKAAMRRNPHFPNIVLHFLGQAYFLSGRYDDAVEVLKKRIRQSPETDSSRVLLAAAYGQLGRVDEARAEWKGALQINPDYSLEDRLGALPFKNQDDAQPIIDGLAKAGLPA